jgi:hypothetical protein
MLMLEVHSSGYHNIQLLIHLFTDLKELIGMCRGEVILYVDIKSTFKWVS